MLTQPEQFPPDRRADPRRRSETRVFDAIQSSDRAGLAIYEWQRNPGSPQLDFAIWTQGGGRFGLQVKGGQISLINGKWYLETPGGPEEKPSPLCVTWDAAMSLREDIIDVLGDTCCFVIAALLFPDMEPDPAIVAEAKRSNVHVLWGTDNLMNRLAAIAGQEGLLPAQRRRHPAGGGRGHRRADRLRRGSPGPVSNGKNGWSCRHSRKPRRFPRLEIPAAGITIGHVDTLIVHTGPGPVTDAGRDPEPGS